ncbi:PLP-dependent aminotransferase family protein [Pseudochrobactrum sp. sp1633]|uniref:aminotransferase-like domain-containing protein n=1 Tax=Pseudochrobactrum sp. sp1633 TaxID=3036706 RepID=UPI0025A540E2|nr:PLP-dependent aminotransferase family protein [Pseudochrobactrum sp. sp1633]MDM8345890.1 PLP-dependent aminotransferase family protein [Pseudochrobactrum sp. sp1633]HWD12253.1 PLP-dependent aminotransferase family protein [Pseudochrobactrum sp.]
MATDFSSQWFADHLEDRTTRGIARDMAALIRRGTLPVGTKLPPIRDLAYMLGISPATISEALSELRKLKIIHGRGRNGTWVCGDHFAAKPQRLMSFGNYGTDVLDLSMAIPDVSLLPSLEKALQHGASASNLNSYHRERILPELEDVVRRDWPYEPEAFLATNGGYNATYTLLHALVTPGASIAIEDPTAMRLLDILEDFGAKIIPVTCDNDGPLPSSLAEALQKKPAAFLFQPRVHSVTSHCMSHERLMALGDVLEGTDTLIIEDDGVADITFAPRQTLGKRFPDRVVHILSYSKSLGPDLRLAVLSGSASVVEQIQSYRSFSSGWTSRILQSAVAWLLNDEATQTGLERAKQIYHQRAQMFADALSGYGVQTPRNSGLCCFLPVTSEQFAMITLAARNIAVAPGSKFSVRPMNAVRIATSILQDEHIEEVANAAFLASKPV